MASPPPAMAKLSRHVTLKLKMPGTPTTPGPARAASNAQMISSAALVETPTAMTPGTPSGGSGGGMRIILKRSQPATPAGGIGSSTLPLSSSSAATAASLPLSSSAATAASLPLSSSAAATAASLPLSSSAAATAAPLTPAVTTTQKGRVSIPTAKKRAHEQMDDSDNEGRNGLRSAGPSTAAAAGAPKRPKLIVKKSLKPKTASIVLKQMAKEAPPRSKGEGYDSEEDERETDPLIEEEFVLRMLPGEHCDYLRRMVEERKVGVPVKEGGADFQLRWLAGAERRALVTVLGTAFVGVLVDLPTITEGMKSWDRRNFMKSADICQMLLVFAAVGSEAEAKSVPLPAMVTKDFRWPHGLTPPMHDCIHRRFRKRLSKKEIKDKEAELQRLLNEDRIAIESKWELIDDGRAATATTAGAGGHGAAADGGADADADADADGDVDMEYFGQQQQRPDGEAEAGSDIDDAELEAMFMEDEDEDEDEAAGGETLAPAAAAAAAATADKPSASKTAGESAANRAGGGGDNDSGTPAAGETSEADGDEDEDEDEDDEDMDEDELAHTEQVKGVREDISELKKQLEVLDKNLAATQNVLLRRRIEENKKRVLSELRLKQASIGELDEEEE